MPSQSGKIMNNSWYIHSIYLVLGILALSPLAASAEMQINNSIIVFKSDDAVRRDITVTNNGDTPLYLKVTPYVIDNPGTTTEQRKKIVDPRESGLLVSPHKLVVPPGRKKRIRFVNLHPKREQEAVFRVTMEPVAGELTAKGSGIKVMVGYEVLVLAEPDNPHSELVAQRLGNRLVIANEGNTNALLFRGKQCPSDHPQQNECASLQDKRLYPGNRWEIALPGSGPVEFHVANSQGNSLKTFP